MEPMMKNSGPEPFSASFFLEYRVTARGLLS
jgi:hypothetical protein